MITEGIDFAKELDLAKKRISLECKEIKSFSLYNYLNDGKYNLILDCRNFKDSTENPGELLIRDSFLLADYIKNSNFKLECNTRLILIMDKEQNLKIDKNLEELRLFIKNSQEIKEIFSIRESFNNFTSKFRFFFLKRDSSTSLKQIASVKYPSMIVDNILFCGSFFNSRNYSQIQLLGIKSIIGLMKENDEQIKKHFDNYNFFEVDEANHSEIEISDIISLIESEIEIGKTPILLYCFSGQTCSLVVAIAYLMKTKKWNINFATAYIMKICNIRNFPGWLYTQLNRINFKDSSEKKLINY